MPPRKPEAPKPPPLIGRFGTSLKIGIVGLPNVGYVLLIHNVRCYHWGAGMNTAADTLFTAGNPPSSMCLPKAKSRLRTSHSAQSIQMRAGFPFLTSATTFSANSINQSGVCPRCPCTCISVFHPPLRFSDDPCVCALCPQ